MEKINFFSNLLKSFQKDKIISFKEKDREQFLNNSGKNIRAEFVDPFNGKLIIKSDENGNYIEKYKPSIYTYCLKILILISFAIGVTSSGIWVYNQLKEKNAVPVSKAPP